MKSLDELLDDLAAYVDTSETSCLSLPPDAYLSPELNAPEVRVIFEHSWLSTGRGTCTGPRRLLHYRRHGRAVIGEPVAIVRGTDGIRMAGFGPEAIQGIVPPMTTPFSASGAIDEAAFRAEARFLLDAGVHGLAVGGSTGEGHALSTEEVRRLTEIAVEEADGRVPVVAGIIVDSTGQAIERGGAAAAAGAAALQVTPVHYLFRPDDAHMKEHFREMTETVAAPVVIYNVVPWTYLSPELLVQIMEDVPDVVGVKQSAGDLKLLADLLATAPDGARIMSAVDALMYPSFALGAHGAIAAILTAAPRALVELWDAVAAGDHAAALDLHGRLLALWNAMHGDNLPAAVKAALDHQGIAGGLPRRPMPAASSGQRKAIAAALERLPR